MLQMYTVMYQPCAAESYNLKFLECKHTHIKNLFYNMKINIYEYSET